MSGMDYDVWKDSILAALRAKEKGIPRWWKVRNWKLYVPSHEFHWAYVLVPMAINVYCAILGMFGVWHYEWLLLFFVYIHWAIDFLTHKKAPVGGWKPWAKYVEIGLWIPMGYWIIKRIWEMLA